MIPPRCSENLPMLLGLAEQLNPFLCVRVSDNLRGCGGLGGKFHMIAIVSRKSEPGAGKCVVLLNEIHQSLLLIISVTDRTPHLLALEAFPAEWHGSNFFPGSDVLRVVKPFLVSFI